MTYMEIVDMEPITDSDMNERQICKDCLGCGVFDRKPCIYCKGSGRVLTYRARVLREQYRERLNAAAPALYEAVKELIGVEYRHGSPAKRKAEFLAAIEQGRSALALVNSTDEEVK